MASDRTYHPLPHEVPAGCTICVTPRSVPGRIFRQRTLACAHAPIGEAGIALESAVADREAATDDLARLAYNLLSERGSVFALTWLIGPYGGHGPANLRSYPCEDELLVEAVDARSLATAMRIHCELLVMFHASDAQAAISLANRLLSWQEKSPSWEDRCIHATKGMTTFVFSERTPGIWAVGPAAVLCAWVRAILSSHEQTAGQASKT